MQLRPVTHRAETGGRRSLTYFPRQHFHSPCPSDFVLACPQKTTVCHLGSFPWHQRLRIWHSWNTRPCSMQVQPQTSQQAPASLPDPAQLPPVGQVSVLVLLRDKCFLLDLGPDRTPASPQGVLSQHSHCSHFQGHPWDTKVCVPSLRRFPYGSKGQVAPGDLVMSSEPLSQGHV